MTSTVPPVTVAAPRRLQASLSFLALFASVAATAVLVATPAPRAAPARPPTRAAAPLPGGLRLEVRGGEAFAAYEVADRLTASGGDVVAVSPAAAGRSVEPMTSVVYYDRRSMAVATRVRDLLGRGTLRRQQVFQPEVDVTIVLGKDLPQS